MQKPEIIRGSLDEILSRFDIREQDLSLTPAYSCSHGDVAAFLRGNKLTVGYLGYSDAHFNPIEEYDCIGELINKSDSPSAFYEAMGRDSYGELCESIAENGELKEEWLKAAMRSLEFTEHARNWLWEDGIEAIEERIIAEVAESVFHNGKLASSMYLADFSAYSEAVKNAWVGGIETDEGTRFSCPVTLGNDGATIVGPDEFVCPDKCVDQWDAVWVPCETTEELIIARAEVLRFGAVESKFDSQRRELWYAKLKPEAGAEESPDFSSWHDAYAWLEAFSQKNDLATKLMAVESCSLRNGEIAAALNVAESSLYDYDCYLRGEHYASVYEDFVLEPGDDESEPSWVKHDFDACCGYFGDAYVLLRDIVAGVESIAEFAEHELEQQAEPQAA